MIFLKLKNSDKLEEILKILKDTDYEISTKKSWKYRILEFLGIYKEEKKLPFEEKVTDEYIKNHPHDDRYKNLPISVYRTIKEKTFQKYPDVFNWDTISKLNLTTEFMIENIDLLNKDILSSKILSTEFIISKYLELNINQVFKNNNMVNVYIELYNKLKNNKELSEEEANFIRYLNVWNIHFNYSKTLEEMGRKDVIDTFINGWVSSFIEEESEEESEEENV